jgi:hypothetical protein
MILQSLDLQISIINEKLALVFVDIKKERTRMDIALSHGTTYSISCLFVCRISRDKCDEIFGEEFSRKTKIFEKLYMFFTHKSVFYSYD